jgi:energy-coupling factor transporter ATP-binding protein EcfA2
LPPGAVGIRSNPFATRFTRPGALGYCFAPAETTGPSAVERLVRTLAQRRAGLIVGPHGSGKTTLLHSLAPALRQRFSAVDSLRLRGCDSTRLFDRIGHTVGVDRQVQGRLASAKRCGLIVIDGGEQLSAWQWRRLMRRVRRGGPAVLATSHRPLSGIEVLYRTGLDAKLIQCLTERLLRDVPSDIASVARDALECRDLNKVSDLREFWFELYDLLQSRLLSPEISTASVNQDGRPIERDRDSVPSADGGCPADDRRSHRTIDWC